MNESINKPDKEDLNNIMEELESTYHAWLAESNLSESSFLAYRTVEKFKMVKKNFEEGQAQIFMAYIDEGECQIIGIPVLSPSAEDNDLFYDNACMLFVYLAGKLDKANRENPINGSYCNDYFGDRVRKFFRTIIAVQDEN